MLGFRRVRFNQVNLLDASIATITTYRYYFRDKLLCEMDDIWRDEFELYGWICVAAISAVGIFVGGA